MKKLIESLYHFIFIRLPAKKVSNFPKNTNFALGLATIAFNNSKVINWQIKLLKKHITDPYKYYVIDNSNNLEQSKEIKKICEKTKTAYIRLTKLKLDLAPSISHGFALDWTYRNIFKKSSYQFIGFLDHDIFPIKKTLIKKIMREKIIYGLKQTRDERWYLWPGFSFFNLSYLQGKNISFLPGNGLDTGGKNYPWLKILNKNQLLFAKQKYASSLKLIKEKKSAWSKISNQLLTEKQKIKYVEKDILVEFLDHWIHVFNSSDWKKTGNKNASVDKLLLKL